MSTNSATTLASLDQVELKLALCDDGAPFQRFVTSYLVPLLTVGSDQDMEVRNRLVKVMSLLMNRIKSHSELELPWSELFELVTGDAEQLVRLFTLQVIELRVGNVPEQLLIQLMNGLVHAIATSPSLKGSIYENSLKIFLLLAPKLLTAFPKTNYPSQLPAQHLPNFYFTLIQFFLKSYDIFVLTKTNLSKSHGPSYHVKAVQLSLIKLMVPIVDGQPKLGLDRYKLVLCGLGSMFGDVRDLSGTLMVRFEQPDLDNKVNAKELLDFYLDKGATPNLKVQLLTVMNKYTLPSTTLPQSIYILSQGLHSSDLHKSLPFLTMQFGQKVIDHLPTNQLQPLAQLLHQSFMKLVSNLETDESSNSSNLIGLTYLVIAKLVKRCPSQFNTKLDLLKFYLERLDRINVYPQIKDGLNLLVDCYKSSPPAQLADPLWTLLESHVNGQLTAGTYFGLKYMAELYPRNHLDSNYLLTVNLTNADPGVSDACKGYLIGNNDRDGGVDLVELGLGLIDKFNKTYFQSDLSNPRVMESLLALTNVVYHYLSGKPITPSDLSGVDPEPISSLSFNNLKMVIAKELDLRSDRVKSWMGWLISAISTYHIPYVRSGLFYYYNLLSVSPVALTSELREHIAKLVGLVSGSITLPVDTALEACRSLSILIMPILDDYMDDADTDSILNQLSGLTNNLFELLNLSQSNPRSISNRAMSLATLLGKLVFKYPSLKAHPEIVNRVQSLIKLANPANPNHQTLLTVLPEIGRFMDLSTYQFPAPISKSKLIADQPNATEVSFLVYLLSFLKGSDIKLATLALTNIGQCSPYLEFDLETLKDIIDLKYPLNTKLELYVKLGETIASLGMGYHGFLLYQHATGSELSAHPSSDATLTQLIEILAKSADSDSLPLRKGVAFGTISLIQAGCHSPILIDRYQQLHSILVGLLKDKEDLIQALAGYGLSLLFDTAPEEVKDRLVDDLTVMFRQPRTDKANPLILGHVTRSNNPLERTGSEWLGYQPMLTLAMELNQPSLIYPFLTLAHTRIELPIKRSTFSDSNELVNKAKSRLEPYIHLLLPRLFRLKYHPEAKVKGMMTSIFAGAIEGRDISKFGKDTIAYAIEGMSDRSWQVRQASCQAIGELLPTIKVENLIIDYIDPILSNGFRCLDDIKESVRTVGLATCQSVLTLSTNLIATNLTTRTTQIVQLLNQLVPLLLNKGVHSEVKDIQLLAITTIQKLVQDSSELMQPFVGEVVLSLLDGLSDQEDRAIDYLSFHIDPAQLSLDQLDQFRLAQISSSPMFKSIERCILLINDDVMNKLIIPLCRKARTSAGLPTRYATAKVMELLAKSTFLDMKLFSEKLAITCLEGLVGDKSGYLRRIWRDSFVQLTNHLNETKFQAAMNELVNGYLNEFDNLGRRQMISSTIHHIAIKSINPMVRDASFKQGILTLGFMGKFDQDVGVGVSWSGVIDELGGGVVNSLSIELIQNKVIETCLNNLKANQYQLRSQAAQALNLVITTLSTSMMYPTQTIYQFICQAIQASYYDGKHFLLPTLTNLIVHHHTKLDLSTLPILIQKHLIRTKHLTFLTKSIQAINTILNTDISLNIYTMVSKRFRTVLTQSDTELLEDGDYDDDVTLSDQHKLPKLNQLKGLMIQCLFNSAINELKNDNDKKGNDLVDLIKFTKDGMRNQTWIVKDALLNGLKKVLEMENKTNTAIIIESLESILGCVEIGLGEVKYIAIRQLALDVTLLAYNHPNVQSNDLLLSEVVKILKLAKNDGSSLISERVPNGI